MLWIGRDVRQVLIDGGHVCLQSNRSGDRFYRTGQEELTPHS